MTTNELDAAIREFLRAFCPAIEARRIFKGYPNRGSLPAGKSYLVFTVVRSVPKSLGSDYFESPADPEEPGVWTATELNFVTYRADVYGPDSGLCLANLKAIFRSGLGADFFARYLDRLGGVGIAGVGEVENATRPDGTSEYAVCHSLEFTVAVRFTAGKPQYWTDRLRIALRGAE